MAIMLNNFTHDLTAKKITRETVQGLYRNKTAVIG